MVSADACPAAAGVLYWFPKKSRKGLRKHMGNIQFDILDFIQNCLRTPVGDGVMPIITRLGNGGILWIVTGLLLMISRKHRKNGILLLTALIVEALLCNVWLKNAVAAPRPCHLNPTVELLIACPQDYSFPSGHTGASFAAVTALWLGKERRWYLALIPALLIAFSRMYLYVHFPADILGGVLVGVISGFLAFGVIRILSGWYGKRKKFGV